MGEPVDVLEVYLDIRKQNVDLRREVEKQSTEWMRMQGLLKCAREDLNAARGEVEKYIEEIADIELQRQKAQARVRELEAVLRRMLHQRPSMASDSDRDFLVQARKCLDGEESLFRVSPTAREDEPLSPEFLAKPLTADFPDRIGQADFSLTGLTIKPNEHVPVAEMTPEEMAAELRHWQKIGGPRAGQIYSEEWKVIAEAAATALETNAALLLKVSELSRALGKAEGERDVLRTQLASAERETLERAITRVRALSARSKAERRFPGDVLREAVQAIRSLLPSETKETLEEWEAHVIAKDGRSWCGEYIGNPPSQFALVDAEHAQRCVSQDTRTQPCPKCWAAIQETP